MTDETTVETPVNDNAEAVVENPTSASASVSDTPTDGVASATSVSTAPEESLLKRFEEWFKAEEAKTTVEIHDWFVKHI